MSVTEVSNDAGNDETEEKELAEDGPPITLFDRS